MDPISFHIDGVPKIKGRMNRGSREGIWWLPNNNSEALLVLTNQGAATINAQLTLRGTPQEVSTTNIRLDANQSLRLSLRELLRKARLRAILDP